MSNEYILKVLFSCRTLEQLKACEEWVLKTYNHTYGEERLIGDDSLSPNDLTDSIYEMKKYIRRT